MTLSFELTVNGERHEIRAAARTTLADALREELELTGTHVGCGAGSCGACLVKLDGVPVHSCLVLAAQAEGARIETIEGLDASGQIADLQEEFHRHNALQCGYCTPGMLLSAEALLRRDPAPDRATIREALSGNYCRCTGYHAIVEAIFATAERRRGAECA